MNNLLNGKKVTFTTLKSLAKKGKLTHKIKDEFDGMTDGLEKGDMIEKVTTVEDLTNFKTVSKNWLRVEDDGTIKLTNCCYRIIFTVVA
jgi:hypothetical protein